MTAETSAIVIGAGPAGLMAAETMASAGRSVVVHDASPSSARKFLLAGRGGLNLTHSEPLKTFFEHYGPGADRLRPAIEAFPPDRLRGWAAELGEETFIGSSGRVFPKSFKATPLLRAWLRRMRELGVDFVPRSRFLGLDGDRALRFMTPSGERSVQAGPVVFALGGASWPRLGADGFWVEAFRAEGIAVTPLKPANCGFLVDWSPKIQETFAGAPLKNIALSHDRDARSRRGDDHARRPRRRRDLRALRLASGSDRYPWIGDDQLSTSNPTSLKPRSRRG